MFCVITKLFFTFCFQKIFSAGFWENSNKIVHPELKRLFDQLRATCVLSRATSTVEKYAYSFKRFITWAENYSEITSVLPADELYVSLYLQSLMRTKRHYSTVESAFYGIKWAHNLAAVNNPCDSPIVISIVDAAKRSLNRPVVKKEPVKAQVLVEMFNRFYGDGNNLKNLRLLAMCFLSYFGFFRYDELCRIKAKYVTFKDDHIDIFIEKSKTDCFHKGNHVYIATLKSNLCPVKILSQYFLIANIDLGSDMYLFRPIIFHKKSGHYTLRVGNTHLSYTRSRELVREALREIGKDPSKFGLHSFRSGGATAAANNNVSDRLFKMHGRWKTDLAKDGYVSENLQKRLSVSKSLGLD